MKFLGSQLAYLVSVREMRTNIRSLLQYVAFLAALVVVYAVLFHVIMISAEGQQHSWVTGFYWTLVVMSTLGFGDITFTSDIGRLFSIVVLLSGVVGLLVMMPFLFIRLFYAPWLEARVRLRAPRQVPAGTAGHILIARYDALAAALVERLGTEGLPYFIIEPDPVRAGHLITEDLSVLSGENDSRLTYERALAGAARMVLVNSEDTTNTNIILTIRECALQVPVVAIAEEEDSIDILQLSGATTVLPLKQQLGEYLANRVALGRAEAHVIGSYGPIQVADLPVRNTPLAGVAIRDTQLRERTGVSVVGLWTRGRLLPAYPHSVLADDAVVVLAGTATQFQALDALLPQAGALTAPVIVIGAGKVGQAAARAITRRGIRVHAVERDPHALAAMAHDVAATFSGDAADRDVLSRAGIAEAPTVLLTTNDDAMNIYLAVYCRRLNRDVRIVSRITHDRNVEAIHRAGADFVLSYTSLGVEAVMSLVRGHELLVLGEGVELFTIPVPASLARQALRDTGIGSLTGMSVVAVKRGDHVQTDLTGEDVLPHDAVLVVLGSLDQRRQFTEAFERTSRTGPGHGWRRFFGRPAPKPGP
ncbi:MAG: NAD-binding protein [Vicinamibacterales bacterium]|nr:NAD-binding protein [Vicinamibacterales bacterium]